MQSTQFIWKNGCFIPWHDAHVHVLAHGLHYGSGVFEGIRFYETASGPAIFKLREHVDRFFYSAAQLAMPLPYFQEDISQAIIDTVKCNKIKSGYIRPLAFYGYGSMKVVPEDDLPVEIIIACWPWGNYLAQTAVDVKTSHYIRIHPQSTIANAKISGHYINSLVAGLAIKNTHYHEVLLLDAMGYVAEASTSNIFIVKNNQLITPPCGTILEGITRQTVIEIAQHLGMAVAENKLTHQDVIHADEAFFTGTAVEITPIRSLDDMLIATGEIGVITQKIQTFYKKIIHGNAPSFQSALTWITPTREAAA